MDSCLIDHNHRFNHLLILHSSPVGLSLRVILRLVFMIMPRGHDYGVNHLIILLQPQIKA